MKFETNCFIKKNNREIIEELIKLDYNLSQTFSYDEPYIFITEAGLIYSSSNPIISIIHDKRDGFYGYNCEYNDKLFLALASLRQNTCKNQWCICTKEHLDSNMNLYKIGSWIKCNTDKLSKHSCYKKANIEDIIKHFNHE